MKVLVTGGAGFIASHIVERLLARGDEALVVDTFATSRRDTLIPHPRLRVIEASIADAERLKVLFREFRPDRVVHAAASYKEPRNWTEDVLTNTLGTAHVAAACKELGVQRLIYFQTSLCYGLQPLEQPITLSHPLRPMGSYAITKTAGEQFIQTSGVDFVSFRLANIYGPRNLSGPIPTFYQRLTQNKPCFVMDARRDFLFVDDLVDLAVAALDGRGRSGVYHVSSGSDSSIKEIYDLVLETLGVRPSTPVEMRPRGTDDAPSILLDPSKTTAEFGWKAMTPLKVGIPQAIDWYRKHGVSQTFTHLTAANLREKG